MKAPSLVVGDQVVVGEDDRAGHEFGPIDGLESPYGLGLAVPFVCRLVGEDDEADELGGVVALLPGRVEPRSGSLSVT